MTLPTWPAIKVIFTFFINFISFCTYHIIDSFLGRGCGGSLYNTEGIFTSPMYPVPQEGPSDCRWSITVPQNTRIGISFVYFDLGDKETCESNYVQIFEVIDEGTEKEVTRFCGGDNPWDIVIRSSAAVVRFKKTVDYYGSGFKASFAAIVRSKDNLHI